MKLNKRELKQLIVSDAEMLLYTDMIAGGKNEKSEPIEILKRTRKQGKIYEDPIDALKRTR
ncbi:hypothetical protein ACSLBF_19775 (plasmid) [Pseudoalteromonas sp. T1lg65]|uniref:hypothetical protein n=1 Tax=Pseudoalteromonas sp. T1lg65 TaxID=2077101 RepID=UPI003F7948A2